MIEIFRNMNKNKCWVTHHEINKENYRKVRKIDQLLMLPKSIPFE